MYFTALLSDRRTKYVNICAFIRNCLFYIYVINKKLKGIFQRKKFASEIWPLRNPCVQVSQLRDSIPFAVIGANATVEIAGKKVRIALYLIMRKEDKLSIRAQQFYYMTFKVKSFTLKKMSQKVKKCCVFY